MDNDASSSQITIFGKNAFDRADKTAPSKGKRKGSEPTDQGKGKRVRLKEVTSENVRGRLQPFSDIWSIPADEPYTQTWFDANCGEKPFCSPSGPQPQRGFALLDPREPKVYTARTLCVHFMSHPERGRTGAMMCFGGDKHVLTMNYCKCKQCSNGEKP